MSGYRGLTAGELREAQLGRTRDQRIHQLATARGPLKGRKLWRQRIGIENARRRAINEEARKRG